LKIRGRAITVGDNIDTDQIIPAVYLTSTDPAELAKHCLEGYDEKFPSKIKEGDILIAGENFGCGSSREHAPWAIKGAGIQCIIAKSFARIFFRNAINIGLPIVECPEGLEAEDGDEVEVDFEEGKVRNITKGKEYKTQSFPPFLQEIIDAGGLIGYARRRLSG
jgi:3-isopropylmalate/(R)-2-methylmalate dehydratase small subunit